MEYKSYISKRQNDDLSDLASSLKKRCDIVIILNTDSTRELNFDEILDLVNKRISSIFNPNNQSSEDIFQYQNPKYIESILDDLIEVFNSQEIQLTFEQITEFMYLEFVCWILNIYEDPNIIYKAISIFNQIYYVTDKCAAVFDSVPIVYNHLKSYDPLVLDSIGNLLILVFESNMQNAIELIRNEDLMGRLFEVAKRSLNIYYFFERLLQETIFTEFGKNVDPAIIQNIIHISLPYLTVNKNREMTKMTIEIFQIISFNSSALMMAQKMGLENQIIKAMGIQPLSNVLLLYTIIRNIFHFVSDGELHKTNFITDESFYTKTASMIAEFKNNDDVEVVFTTLGNLGCEFWEHFIQLGILDSILSNFPNFNYSNKKSVTSILISIFTMCGSEFRAKWCIPPIVEIFIELLDEKEDKEFVLELINGLFLLLQADRSFFVPIFMELEIIDQLSDLCEDENEEVAEAAQSLIKELQE